MQSSAHQRGSRRGHQNQMARREKREDEIHGEHAIFTPARPVQRQPIHVQGEGTRGLNQTIARQLQALDGHPVANWLSTVSHILPPSLLVTSSPVTSPRDHYSHSCSQCSTTASPPVKTSAVLTPNTSLDRARQGFLFIFPRTQPAELTILAPVGRHNDLQSQSPTRISHPCLKKR